MDLKNLILRILTFCLVDFLSQASRIFQSRKTTMVTLADQLETRLTVADLPSAVRRRYSAAAAVHMDTASSVGSSSNGSMSSSVYKLSPMRRRSEMPGLTRSLGSSGVGNAVLMADVGRGFFQQKQQQPQQQRSLRKSYTNTSSDDCSIVGKLWVVSRF